MTASELEALMPRLLALPIEERLLLGELLIESVDTFSEDELRERWRDELARRIDELKSGAVQGIPAAEVHDEIRRQIAALRNGVSITQGASRIR